jgi:hypothetical protein
MAAFSVRSVTTVPPFPRPGVLVHTLGRLVQPETTATPRDVREVAR